MNKDDEYYYWDVLGHTKSKKEWVEKMDECKKCADILAFCLGNEHSFFNQMNRFDTTTTQGRLEAFDFLVEMGVLVKVANDQEMK